MNAAEAYTRELSKPDYAPLDYDEERKLLHAFFQGDEDARDKLIKSNLRFVSKVARAFGAPDDREECMDLIQEGNFGLIYALPRYKMTNTCRLCSYAFHWIRFFIRSTVTCGEYKHTVLLPDYPNLAVEADTTSTIARDDLERFLRKHMTAKEVYVLIEKYYLVEGRKPKNLEEIAVELRCTSMNVGFIRKSAIQKLQKVKEEFEAFSLGLDYG